LPVPIPTLTKMGEYGADPNGQVYASGTPLSEAYGQRDSRMIQLLERYGVLTREAALGEGLEGGFAGVYPVLKAMEETGRLR